MIEFEPGRLEIYAAKASINTSATPKDAEEQADKFNEVAHIKTEFFDNPSLLNRLELPSGSIITIKDPSGRYANKGALLITATGPDLFNMDNEEQVPTQSIYDLPEDAQEAYWQHIIAGMQAFTTLAKTQRNQNHIAVFAVENCIVTRTNGVRTSRTIAKPHAHVNMLDTSYIKPFEKEMSEDPEREQKRLKPLEETTPHYVLEQQLLQRQRLITGFVRRIQSHVVRNTEQSLQALQVRQNKPYGYSFTPSLSNDIQEIAYMMRAHHQAYTENAQRLFGKFKDSDLTIIPQPSYRLFMELDENGVFTVSSSPEALSYSGALEVMGIELKRGAEYPLKIKEAEVEAANNYASTHINNQLRLLPTFIPHDLTQLEERVA